jgi:hypothetical protein
VRVKYESYWEQKEEKRKREEIQRHEMEAFKESFKHAQEVGGGFAKKLKRLSKDISNLMQSM